MKMARWIACAGLLALSASACPAAVYYVKSAGLDANDGLSWTTAKKTLAGAISSAASGSEIWVAGGPAYQERITLKSGVSLYGGFAGTESTRGARNPTANLTIIDGGNNGTVVTATNAIASTVLDGFTIRNGYGDGITLNTCAMTVSNNVISGNANDGIYCNAGAPIVSNNRIVGNYYGMDCFYKTTATVSGNTISGSTVWGMRCNNSAVTISGNTIRDNGQSGILCQSAASIIATGNFIAYNSTGIDGGGIVLAGGTPIIDRNTILGNRANGKGGGIYINNATAKVRNNIIAWNTASESGGIRMDTLAPVSVTNNTIVFNATYKRSAGAAITLDKPFASPAPTFTIANNIVAYNTTGINVISGAGAPTLSHNCLWSNGAYNYNGLAAGGTDILFDPLFASVGLGDYHLTATSPCLNAGDDAQVLAGAKDVDAETRIAGTHVDIGADEYYAGRTIVATRLRYYVKIGGSDAANGLSWAAAKATLQAVLAIAHPGDSIWVGKGTYAESDLTMPAAVAILGGFAGIETQDSQRNPAVNQSIVDPSSNSGVITAQYLGATSVIDGMVIRHAGSGSFGAVECDYSAITLSNCTIESGNGIGLNIYIGSPTVTVCTIRSNYSSGIAAYLGDPLVTGCTITGNTGSGISLSSCTGLISGCTIQGNSNGSAGGGVYVSSGTPVFMGNVIRQNTATGTGGRGGGAYLLNTNCQFISNVIAQNTADKAAGMKIESSTNPLITNNTLASNTAKSSSEAGGIEIETNSSPAIANNIIAFNVGNGVMLTGGTGSPQPASNCVYGNTGVAYKNMSGGGGDILVDPILRDPAHGDFHIKYTSPCVNAGSDLYLLAGSTDMDSQPRLYGTHVDIGADEVRPFGIADFNGDGRWDAVANDTTTGEIAVLLMNGPTIVSSYSLDKKLPAGWLVGGTGDFLNDGTTSLAVQNLATQQISILGINGKYITSSTPLLPPMLPNYQIRCTGDFNGDGRPDIVCQNTVTRAVSVLVVSGSKIVASLPINPTLPAGWVVVGTGDFDGNGTTDIVVQNTSTQQVSVLFMSGTTIVSSASITPNLPSGWSIVGVSDVNGDGRPDILVQNGSTRQVSALLVTGLKFTGSLPVNPTLPANWALVGPR